MSVCFCSHYICIDVMNHWWCDVSLTRSLQCWISEVYAGLSSQTLWMRAVMETSQPKQTNGHSSLSCPCVFFPLESWCAGLISVSQPIHDASLEMDGVFPIQSHSRWGTRCYVTRNLACSALQIVILAPAEPTDIIVFVWTASKLLVVWW